MDVKRAFWGLKLKLRLHEATGHEFQTLVQQLMELRFPTEFVTVKPAGRDGDWKNDGLLTAQRRLLQVYAPEGWDKTKALRKIHDDYSGAASYWGDVFDSWTLVHNNLRGIPPYVLDTLQELSKSNASGHALDHWGYAKIRDLVFELDDHRLIELLGPPVTEAEILATEVRDVVPVLRELQSTTPAALADVTPVPPDKLDKNGLSEDATMLLLSGMRRSSEVSKYFERQTMRPLFRDDLGARFTVQYIALRDEGMDPDAIVWTLYQWIAGEPMTPTAQAAAWAIIAFFFEQCDIFEDPSRVPL